MVDRVSNLDDFDTFCPGSLSEFQTFFLIRPLMHILLNLLK